MNILALDLGSMVGWASYLDVTPPGMLTQAITSSGVKEIKVGRGTNPDVRFLIFERWLGALCLLKHPDVIAYEKPFMRGGAASEFLGMLMHIVRMFCIRNNLTYMSVTVRELKKFATGDGDASKEKMVLTAEQRYGKVQDDNQADALHVLAWAKEKLNDNPLTNGDRGVSQKA